MTLYSTSINGFLSALANNENIVGTKPHDYINHDIASAVLGEMKNEEWFLAAAAELERDGFTGELYELMKDRKNGYVDFFIENKEAALFFSEKLAVCRGFQFPAEVIEGEYDQGVYKEVTLSEMNKVLYAPLQLKNDDSFSDTVEAVAEWFAETAILQTMAAYNAFIGDRDTIDFLAAVEDKEIKDMNGNLDISIASLVMSEIHSKKDFIRIADAFDGDEEAYNQYKLLKGDNDVFFSTYKSRIMEFIANEAVKANASSTIEFILGGVRDTGMRGLTVDHIAKAVYGHISHLGLPDNDNFYNAYFGVADWVAKRCLVETMKAYTLYKKQVANTAN